MAKIIDARTSIDRTVGIFDAFYSFDLKVNGDTYDIVHGYFQSVSKNRTIADNFTVSLFRISQETKIPVLDLLGYIRGTTKMEMNRILTYYLNSFKSKTTLYGISIIPQANQPVARNIVH